MDEQNNTPVDDGAQQTHWLIDSLPEDQRESAAAWKDKTPADLYQSHAALEAKTKDLLTVPGESATEEEKTAFAAKVRELSGVPETPDGYQITLPDTVPADDPVIVAFKATAHAQGLSPKQVQESVNSVVQTLTDLREAQRVGGHDEIQKLWGKDYDANMDKVLRGFKGLANDAGIPKEEAEAYLEKSGIKYSPTLVRLIAAAGAHYSEDSLNGGNGGGKAELGIAEKLFPKEKMGKYA